MRCQTSFACDTRYRYLCARRDPSTWSASSDCLACNTTSSRRALGCNIGLTATSLNGSARREPCKGGGVRPRRQLLRWFAPRQRSCLLFSQFLEDSAGPQMRVIEFGDHPDPNTGAPKVVQNEQPWPHDVMALVTAVKDATGRPTTVYDMRHGILAPARCSNSKRQTCA
jgi:hypothetical protein